VVRGILAAGPDGEADRNLAALPVENALDPPTGKVGAGEGGAGFRKHGQRVTGQADGVNGGQIQTETLPQGR